MCAQFMQLIASFAKAPKAEMVVQPDTVADDFGGKTEVIVLHAQLSLTPYARLGHPVPREPPLPRVPTCQQGREAGLGPLAFPSMSLQGRQATRPHRSSQNAQRASDCLAWHHGATIRRHLEGG